MKKTDETTCWRGFPLPAVQDGYVWAFHRYPDGRAEVKPCMPEQVFTVAGAMARFQAGGVVIVKPDDAEMIMAYITATQLQAEPYTKLVEVFRNESGIWVYLRAFWMGPARWRVKCLLNARPKWPEFSKQVEPEGIIYKVRLGPILCYARVDRPIG